MQQEVYVNIYSDIQTSFAISGLAFLVATLQHYYKHCSTTNTQLDETTNIINVLHEAK